MFFFNVTKLDYHRFDLKLNEHNSASYEETECNQTDDRTRRNETSEECLDAQAGLHGRLGAEIIGHKGRFTTKDVLDMLPSSEPTRNAKEIISCSATGCTRIAAAEKFRFCLNHMVENLNAERISEEEIKNSGTKSTPRVKFSTTQHKEIRKIHTPFTPNRDRHFSPVSTPKHKAYPQNDTESGPEDYSMLIVYQGQSSVNDSQEHRQLTQSPMLPGNQLIKSPRASEHRHKRDVGACCTPKQDKCIYKNCTNDGSTLTNGVCTRCYNSLLEKNARNIVMPTPVVQTRYNESKKTDENKQCQCNKQFQCTLKQECQCRCISCGMSMKGGCFCGHCELSCFKNKTSDSANVSNKVRSASSNPGAWRTRLTHNDMICHGCPNCATQIDRNGGHDLIGRRINGLEPTLNNAHWNFSDLAIDGPSPPCDVTRSCSQGLYDSVDVKRKHITFEAGTEFCSDSGSKHSSIASPLKKEESCERIYNSENKLKSSYKPTDEDSGFSSILCFGDVEAPYSYLSKGGVWDKSDLD